MLACLHDGTLNVIFTVHEKVTERNCLCQACGEWCIELALTLPGAGVLGKILMGVFRWDSETLSLYQTTFMSFLQPYSRLDAKNPYPIPD